MFKFTLALYLTCAYFEIAHAETLTVAIPNKIESIDPEDAHLYHAKLVLPLIFEYLVEIDDEGNLKNGLLKSWSFNDVSKELKLMIASGHRFSDGSEVSAEDVISSFNRVCRAGGAGPTQMFGLEGCGKSARPFSAYLSSSNEIVLKISVSVSAFLFQLATGRSPVSKIVSTLDGRQIIGSGPYKVQSLNRTSCVLEPNNHWQASPPRFSKIQFKPVSEARLETSLNQSEADIYAMYLESSTQHLRLKDYRRKIYGANITQTLFVNSKVPPFDNESFRRIFAAKIQGSSVASCKNKAPANGLIPLGIPGSLRQIAAQTSAPNVPKKRSLRPIRFYRHKDRKDPCEEQAIVQVGRDLDLDIQFEYKEKYSELVNVYRGHATAGFVELVVFGSRDPSNVLKRFVPNSKDALFLFTSKVIEDLLSKAFKLATVSERGEQYRQINREIASRSAVIPLYYQSHALIFSACFPPSSEDTSFYNPSSFRFLMDLKAKKNCLSRRL